MGHWNYRVIKKQIEAFGEITSTFQIHSVYYHDDGAVSAYSVDPITAYGEDEAETLKDDMFRMLNAFDRPVLTTEQLDKAIEDRVKV